MEIDLTLGGILILGLIIGLQHALEPDHLAALTSLVSGERDWRSMVVHGAVWGVGHTVTLTAVAGGAVFFGTSMTGDAAAWMELLVGLMLIVLGVGVVWTLVRERVHFHVHRHADGTVHFHAHTHKHEPKTARSHHQSLPHDHEHAKSIPWRTLLVGLMHGVAGSAFLVVLTGSQIADPILGVAYVFIFGLGSILGMIMLSGAIALPLNWSATRLTRLNVVGRGVIGVGTAVLGAIVVIESVRIVQSL